MRAKNGTIKFALIMATFLLSVSAALPLWTAQAQEEIPRADVYFCSSSWGPPPGWNPLLPNKCWFATAQYPALFFYSRYTDEWIPYAAESYTWIDKYTLEVKIRDEATWWDGTPVSADDVKYTMELGKRIAVAWITPLWDYIEQVVVIDPKRVQFITSEKKLNYFIMLDVLHGRPILPKHRWEALETEWGSRLATEFRDDDPDEIIGAGPYKLLSWTESVYYYERVDDWWGAEIFGLPAPKYVAHITPKDNVAAALAFEAGELDTMTHFTPKIWEMWEVKQLPVRTYYAHQPYYVGGGVTFLWLNFAKAGLDILAVRRAIANAIPFNEMISKAYYNYSVQAAPVPIIHTGPAARYINNTLVNQYKFDFDLEKAKTILDDAGIVDINGDGFRELPDGSKLGPFVVQVPYGWTDWMMMCDIMVTNFKKIGLDASTEFPDFSVWWQRLTDKNWDIVIGWAAADPGYAHPWNAFRSTMDSRLSHPSGNWENYDNPKVSSLLDAAVSETDPAKVANIYNQLQEMWLRDLPGIPLFYGATWYEYSEAYWVGWPNEENKGWFANFFGDEGTWPDNLPALFGLAPAGTTPSQPAWIADMKFTSSDIFEDLAIAPIHGMITVTVTTTETVTETVTTTVEVSVPTMDVTSVAGAGIVSLIVGVAVGWLVASRKK